MKPWNPPLPLLALTLTATLAGCMSAQVYEGPRRDRDELARISGDLPFTAGAPISVILRRVDDQALSVGQTAVDVLPGEHQLLVDCRIAETKSVSRHTLDVEVDSGRRYRLRAEVAPGLQGCEQVTLQRVN